ncbi:MAG TPA: hypothetical protein VMN03_02695, partial [Burkholderiales bacterium]|nr:hypothetical protein [Burkholderiales bacterium]
MVVRHKERKFGRGCVESWRAQRADLRAAARSQFAKLDAMLAGSGRPWLVGEAPIYTDFLAFGILGNYLYRAINPFPDGL